MTFRVGKILGYRNRSLISLRNIVDWCSAQVQRGQENQPLAAFINCILETQKRHILTIEDPIEFEFQHS